eukprot:TRINITY_DN1608_c0_g3_i1.p1 TRINITY_DN1608_c0_g3~~TRINITY_DN1608_c0_g3_i1.p1  ORF type:complete len:466 (-),score=73.16 TRINITY_DN1608_c0_g3_i1:238-1635(-)
MYDSLKEDTNPFLHLSHDTITMEIISSLKFDPLSVSYLGCTCHYLHKIVTDYFKREEENHYNYYQQECYLFSHKRKTLMEKRERLSVGEKDELDERFFELFLGLCYEFVKNKFYLMKFTGYLMNDPLEDPDQAMIEYEILSQKGASTNKFPCSDSSARQKNLATFIDDLLRIHDKEKNLNMLYKFIQITVLSGGEDILNKFCYVDTYAMMRPYDFLLDFLSSRAILNWYTIRDMSDDFTVFCWKVLRYMFYSGQLSGSYRCEISNFLRYCERGNATFNYCQRDILLILFYQEQHVEVPGSGKKIHRYNWITWKTFLLKLTPDEMLAFYRNIGLSFFTSPKARQNLMQLLQGLRKKSEEGYEAELVVKEIMIDLLKKRERKIVMCGMQLYPELLIEKLDDDGNTAMHIIAGTRGITRRITCDLIDIGASIDQKNRFEETPLDIATRKNTESLPILSIINSCSLDLF